VRSWFEHRNFQDVEKVRFGTVLESPLKERNLFRGTVAHRANPATHLAPLNLKSCNASSRHFSRVGETNYPFNVVHRDNLKNIVFDLDIDCWA
jgi:hypothetical protein